MVKKHLIKKLRFRLPSSIAILYLLLSPADGFDINLCLFKETFGLPCPACGLVRSMSSLIKLDISMSVFYHPLGFIIFVFLIVCMITNDPMFLKHKLFNRVKLTSRVPMFFIFALLFIVVWMIRIS